MKSGWPEPMRCRTWRDAHAHRCDPVLPRRRREAAGHRAVPGHPQRQRVDALRGQSIGDAVQAVRRVGQAVHEEGAAANLLRHTLERAVAVPALAAGIGHAAADEAIRLARVARRQLRGERAIDLGEDLRFTREIGVERDARIQVGRRHLPGRRQPMPRLERRQQPRLERASDDDGREDEQNRPHRAKGPALEKGHDDSLTAPIARRTPRARSTPHAARSTRHRTQNAARSTWHVHFALCTSHFALGTPPSI